MTLQRSVRALLGQTSLRWQRVTIARLQIWMCMGSWQVLQQLRGICFSGWSARSEGDHRPRDCCCIFQLAMALTYVMQVVPAACKRKSYRRLRPEQFPLGGV